MEKALEDRIIENTAGERPVVAMDIVLSPPVGGRVMFRGTTIADSRAVMLMLEEETAGRLLLPRQGRQLDLLQPTSYTSPHAGKGLASFYLSKWAIGSWKKPLALPATRATRLKDYVAFYWDKTDAWFERTMRSSSIPVIPSQGRCPQQLASRQGHRGGEVVRRPPAALAVRDRSADPLLHSKGRRAPGPADAHEHLDPLPLQRQGVVLDRQCRR